MITLMTGFGQLSLLLPLLFAQGADARKQQDGCRPTSFPSPMGLDGRRGPRLVLPRRRAQRTAAGSLRTTSLATSNSSSSMNAATPFGPKASGISVASVGKVPM